MVHVLPRASRYQRCNSDACKRRIFPHEPRPNECNHPMIPNRDPPLCVFPLRSSRLCVKTKASQNQNAVRFPLTPALSPDHIGGQKMRLAGERGLARRCACGRVRVLVRVFCSSLAKPFNSQLSTLNSQLSTLNSQLSALSSQPSTLNPFGLRWPGTALVHVLPRASRCER